MMSLHTKIEKFSNFKFMIRNVTTMLAHATRPSLAQVLPPTKIFQSP